jgi:hypothetical protein
MLSHHDWAHSMQRLDRIIERCVAAYGPRKAGAEKVAERGPAAVSGD